MALITFPGTANVENNRGVDVDTDGDNYIGTIGKGFRGAVIKFTIASGSVTSATVAKRRNPRAKDGASIDPYEEGAITATGGEVAVLSGEGVDLYVTIAGASSLVGHVDIDQFR